MTLADADELHTRENWDTLTFCLNNALPSSQAAGGKQADAPNTSFNHKTHKMHAQRISFLRPAPPWTLFLISAENKATAGVLSTNIKAAWSNKFCPHRYPANTRRDKTEHICFREIFTLVFRQTWHCSITSGWGWGGDRTGDWGK